MTIDPVTRRSRRTALVFGALGAGSVAALWAVSRRRPASLAIGLRRGKPAFVAPSTPVLRGSLVVTSAPFAALLATSPFFAALFDGTTRVLFHAATASVAIVGLGLHIWTLYRAAPLRITPDAIIAPLRRRIPWDALAPDGPSSRSARGTTVWLLVRTAAPDGRPDVRVATTRYSIPPCSRDLRDVYVDPALPGAALRYYRDHSGARPSIGPPDGFQRLLTALAQDVPRVAATLLHGR
ncbi:hypothetical protein [Cryptosporangium phraense]|uniref:Uncharacterized protein n=1 Tax=Cryptosporangium phraense TaxID=2593070 RepID=A0A545AZW3_9ACTN|nr:hypothetical protein [Cryptosporangium phraense]TQS46862.1 hypothetical protein FL583_00865 [Cryptosporangium phraense]